MEESNPLGRNTNALMAQPTSLGNKLNIHKHKSMRKLKILMAFITVS